VLACGDDISNNIDMGTLFVIPTPIGNLADITVRSISTLFNVDILLCEDTRRTGQLLQQLRERYSSFIKADKKVEYMSYYDEIEDKRIPEIVALLQQGKHIGIVSDNGTPAISDPGFRLIRACRERNIAVTVLPGPNAAVTALVSSGLPTNSFYFSGFLPDTKTFREKKLIYIKEHMQSTTIIWYCAPHKLKQTLDSIIAIFGKQQEIVIVKELTKIYEKVWKGNVKESLDYIVNQKGEFILLLYNA
jgi:16S rRNA (cytidine1402-2'-O)-methyltransferase